MQHTNFKGGFWIIKIWIKRSLLNASNFMPEDLLEIICIIERREKHNSYKILRKRNYFSLITKFPAKNGESMPLKNSASAHQDKKEVSSDNKLGNKM